MQKKIGEEDETMMKMKVQMGGEEDGVALRVFLRNLENKIIIPFNFL